MEVAMEGGISTLQQLVCKVNNNIPAESMKSMQKLPDPCFFASFFIVHHG